jgi:hypothetical protein
MAYTVRISETSPQALSIINMLNALAKDYDFLQITEDPAFLSDDQEKELTRRYNYVKKNPTLGKTWSELEKGL